MQKSDGLCTFSGTSSCELHGDDVEELRCIVESEIITDEDLGISGRAGAAHRRKGDKVDVTWLKSGTIMNARRVGRMAGRWAMDKGEKNP